MNFTTKELADIEEFGYAQFNIEKIARALQLNFNALKIELTSPGTAGYNAYYTGRDTADYDVRASTFDLAKRGSLQAIIIAKEYTNQLKQDEI